jgi:hypothetical protein
MKQIRDTLADIDILDSACHTASSRLSSLRLSKVIIEKFFYVYNNLKKLIFSLNNFKLHLNREVMTNIRTLSNDEDEEEAILAQQIKHLITEKYDLIKIKIILKIIKNYNKLSV